MDNLSIVINKVTEFLRDTLKVKDIKIVNLYKSESGWETEAEVYEESSFIKSLGLHTNVQDRNYYNVKLNDNLEVQSYKNRNLTDTEKL